jgi:hypothetical protein
MALARSPLSEVLQQIVRESQTCYPQAASNKAAGRFNPQQRGTTMLRKPEFKLRTLLPCIVVALSGAALAADDDEDDREDYVVREYSFPLTDIEEIEIHASVGQIDIVPIEGNEIRLVLEIEPSEHGWFDRRRDVSDVELESDVRGKRLVLRQTEDDTNTEWTVQMPAVARTSIEMGVGEIDAEFGATELDIDMGVGDVDVSLPESSTGDIDLAAGVGDVTLRGAHDVDNERAFVSQDVHGRGEGDMDARIDVGVGDVRLELD